MKEGKTTTQKAFEKIFKGTRFGLTSFKLEKEAKKDETKDAAPEEKPEGEKPKDEAKPDAAAKGS